MNFTENYELPIYEENDKLNVLVTGNETMRKIDSAMKANSELGNSNKLAHEALATVVESQGTSLDNVITKADETAEEVQTMHTAVNKNTEDIEALQGVKDTVEVLESSFALLPESVKGLLTTKVIEVRQVSSAFANVYATADSRGNMIGRLYSTMGTTINVSNVIPNGGKLLSFDLLEISSVKTGTSSVAMNTDVTANVISNDIKFEITDTTNGTLSGITIKTGSGVNYLTKNAPSNGQLYAEILMKIRVTYIENMEE